MQVIDHWPIYPVRTETNSRHDAIISMDNSFVRFLSDSATELQIMKSGVLFQYGKRADKFYLVRKGQVSVQVPALMGPTLEIQTPGENQILGWSWLVPPYR